MQSRSTWIRFLFAGALATVAMQGALAVTLNARGVGQVLLFPYYTVNANNNTLISIVNTTPHAKAVRVRFAEGQNGRDAYSLNVYLGANDVWTAAIGQTSNGGVASATLASGDNSCTVPAIPAFSAAGGGVQFSNRAFSGLSADAGTADLSRTFDGSIEVIEMGTLIDDSPSAMATYHQGQGCATFIDAWAAGGYWTQDPNTDLRNPTGGLYGTGYIVDVEQGTIFAYDATALGDFRADPLDRPRGSIASVVLHTAPGSAHPNLADALSDPATNIAVAQVQASDRSFTATYPAATQGVDAVSAVLMASTLANDYVADPGAGATTNFIFNYPTRRFYTDPAIAGGQPILPFTSFFSGVQQGTAAEMVQVAFFDRESHIPHAHSCPTNGCPDPLDSPGTSVELLNLGTGAEAILGSELNMSFAGFLGSPLPIGSAGWISFSLDVQTTYHGVYPPVNRRALRPSREGRYFSGLPVLGFGTQNLVNTHLQNGVLANYSSAVTHRVTTNCYLTLAQDPQLSDGPCP